MRVFKFCALFGPLAAGFFIFNAAPSDSSALPLQKTSVETKGVTSKEGIPVFFLTFEKLVSNYFADKDGNFLQREFPNLAGFVNEADYYPNAYTHGAHTLVSLGILYTSQFVEEDLLMPWRHTPHLSQILNRRGKVYKIMDLVNYCDPRLETCVKSIYNSNETRLNLVLGWNKVYLQTVVPRSVQSLLGMYGWSFNPWQDMWLNPGATGYPTYQEAGIRQFNLLKDILKQEGAAGNLYVMHNWISDSPTVQTSSLQNESKYRQELAGWRKKLSLFDREFGRFIRFLKEEGIYEKALIVVTADTGYCTFVDGKETDEELPATPDLVRVFLAIKKPNQETGRIIPAVARHIDVLPTVLAHLDIDPQQYPFKGEPVLDPEDQSTLVDRPLYFYLKGLSTYNVYALKSPEAKTLRRVDSERPFMARLKADLKKALLGWGQNVRK